MVCVDSVTLFASYFTERASSRTAARSGMDWRTGPEKRHGIMHSAQKESHLFSLLFLARTTTKSIQNTTNQNSTINITKPSSTKKRTHYPSKLFQHNYSNQLHPSEHYKLTYIYNYVPLHGTSSTMHAITASHKSTPSQSRSRSPLN